MDDHALQAIEFPRALELLAERCVSGPGGSAARALRPVTDPALVRVLLDETAEVLSLAEAGERLPLVPFEDPSPPLEDVRRRGGVLQPEELLSILALLAAAAGLAQFLGARAGRLPRLAGRMAGADLLRPLAARIRRVIDERGGVRDEASPELDRARGRLRALRDEVRRLLDRFVAEHAPVIQETVIVQRRGRFAVSAKTNYRRLFEGVVLDRSASGETFFVEPLAAVPLNNALAGEREAERAEVERLLRELTAAALASRAGLSSLTGCVAGLDLIAAKAELGRHWRGARAGESREGWLRLRQARHPLLAAGAGAVPPEAVVPVDIALGGPVRQVVITGPNTGGKTVAIKMIGLCVALNQCGLPVPAAPDSELPVVRSLFADIGDEQDLRQSLSTFSGHMARVAEAVRGAGEGALLLLDELGAGTDPAEGSAIGVALLEHLAPTGALVVASTHHDALKHYAFTSPAAENASVEFDPADLSPTYRIRMGAAGPSNALAVAGRMGLPPPVLEKARAVIREGPGRASEVMSALAGRETRLNEREAESRAGRAALEAAQAAFAREHREEKARRRAGADGLLKELRREADAMLAALRAEGDAASAKEAVRERFRGMARRVEEVLPQPGPGPEEEEAHGFRVGDAVRLDWAGRRGVVRSLHRGGVLTVEVEGKAFRLPARSLEPSGKEDGADRSRVVIGHEVPSPAGTFSSELQVRGRRAEEAIEMLDKYLDDALLVGVPRVRILHGKGTGALAKAIAHYLEEHAGVASFGPARPEEGDWGVTQVELAG